MKFNIEEINSVSEGLNAIFTPIKNIFESAKKMTVSAGENTLAETLTVHFKKLEQSFNRSVRPAFQNLKADLGQSVENMEMFDKAMAGVTDPNTSSVDGVDQKRHTQAFGAR